ncbi:MAG TPA: acyl-CoA dehydrogenase family protein [Actinomycetota bacterium]|nr:acyl-CoA dehydrogenase family protein [Actinomycetota bacterium]
MLASTEQPVTIDDAEILELLAEAAATADAHGRPDESALRALRESDLLGTVIPAEYGGRGEDVVVANRRIAEVASADPSTAIILFQHYAVSARILEWGTEDQRERILPKLASGEWLAASAWSETGAGAAKRNLQTRGVRLPDGSWKLDGAKSFTTGAGLAQIYLVLVQTGDAGDDDGVYGASGQTFFLVESDRPGVEADTSLDLTGMRGSSTGFVQLHDCVVPPDAVLGPLGEAPRVIAGVRKSGLTLGAVSLGIAQAAYDLAVSHARGRGMLEQQTVRRRLVNMHMRVEAVRSVVERASRRDADNPGVVTLFSKIFASETSEEICRDAQQLLGSMSFVRGSAIDRLSRDARAVSLMGPTNELSRDIVAGETL